MPEAVYVLNLKIKGKKCQTLVKYAIMYMICFISACLTGNMGYLSYVPLWPHLLKNIYRIGDNDKNSSVGNIPYRSGREAFNEIFYSTGKYCVI